MKWVYTFLSNFFCIILFISIGSFFGFVGAEALGWISGRERRLEMRVQWLEERNKYLEYFIQTHDHKKDKWKWEQKKT